MASVKQYIDRLKWYGNNCWQMVTGQPVIYRYTGTIIPLSWGKSLLARNLMIHHPNLDETSLIQVYLREQDVANRRAKKIRQMIDANQRLGEKDCISIIMRDFYNTIIDHLPEMEKYKNPAKNKEFGVSDQERTDLENTIKKSVRDELIKHFREYILWKQKGQQSDPPKFICPLTKYSQLVQERKKKNNRGTPRHSRNSQTPAEAGSRNSPTVLEKSQARKNSSPPGTPVTPTPADIQMLELKKKDSSNGSNYQHSPNQLNPSSANKKLFAEENAKTKNSTPNTKNSPLQAHRQLDVPHASENKLRNEDPVSRNRDSRSSADIGVENSDQIYPDPVFIGIRKGHGVVTKNPLRWVKAIPNVICEVILKGNAEIFKYPVKGVFASANLVKSAFINNDSCGWAVAKFIPRFFGGLMGLAICGSLSLPGVGIAIVTTVTKGIVDTTFNLTSFVLGDVIFKGPDYLSDGFLASANLLKSAFFNNDSCGWAVAKFIPRVVVGIFGCAICGSLFITSVLTKATVTVLGAVRDAAINVLNYVVKGLSVGFLVSANLVKSAFSNNDSCGWAVAKFIPRLLGGVLGCVICGGLIIPSAVTLATVLLTASGSKSGSAFASCKNALGSLWKKIKNCCCGERAEVQTVAKPKSGLTIDVPKDSPRQRIASHSGVDTAIIRSKLETAQTHGASSESGIELSLPGQLANKQEEGADQPTPLVRIHRTHHVKTHSTSIVFLDGKLAKQGKAQVVNRTEGQHRRDGSTAVQITFHRGSMASS